MSRFPTPTLNLTLAPSLLLILTPESDCCR